jgi:DNA-directed RNA polymerase subunit RPC12/RpoP
MAQGYCLKCKAHKEIKDPETTTLKNGKPAVKGLCPTCGGKIFRIGAAK